MSDYNPTEPDQQPADSADMQNDHPGLLDQEPEIYEGDTRPSLGTIQSMQQAQSPDNASESLRSGSQSFTPATDPVAPPTFSASSAGSDTAAGSSVSDPSIDVSNEAQMAKAASIQARYSDRLLQLPHVVGVGIGYMKVGDQLTNQVALIVMVDQKVAASELRSNEMIPKQIEDIPIMVQEVGSLRAF